MELVINTYGSYIHVNQKSFEIKSDNKKQRVSVKKISSILIATGAAISSDAVKLALENNIEIYFLDGYGNPKGKIWHCKLGSTTYIRRRQLEIAETKEGTRIIKELLYKKTDGTIAHLKEMAKKRVDSKKEYLKKRIEEIEKLKTNIQTIEGKTEDIRNSLMGYEGNISTKYYDCISYLLPDRYKFNGRSFRPAKDEYNCLINYGYGVLYSKVEKALIIAGFDPYVGILHTDGYNKKSFVFDFIEPYRHHVNRAVMALFSRKQVKTNHFDEIKNGLTLNREGRQFLLQNLNEYFVRKVHYNGRNIKIENTIQFDAHKLANEIIKKGD